MDDNIFNKYRYFIDFDISKYDQFLNWDDLSEDMIENEIKRNELYSQCLEIIKKQKMIKNKRTEYFTNIILILQYKMIKLDIDENLLLIYGRLNEKIDKFDVNEIKKYIKKDNKFIDSFLIYVNEKYKNGIYKNLNIKYLKSKQALERYNILMSKLFFKIKLENNENDEEIIEYNILYLNNKFSSDYGLEIKTKFDEDINEIYNVLYDNYSYNFFL